jgi:hypothetical protein
MAWKLHDFRYYAPNLYYLGGYAQRKAPMRISHVTLVTTLLALAPISAYALPTMFQHADTMSVSLDIPAAQGKVKFGKADNGNTSIDLMVKYLAEPQKLQPPEAIYVAWVSQDQDSPAQNLGALMVDDLYLRSSHVGLPLGQTCTGLASLTRKGILKDLVDAKG